MYCTNCGKSIPENSKFCRYCGAKQTNDTAGERAEGESGKRKGLTCPSCGAALEVSESGGATVLTCLFCGYREMLSESDAVKIQKLKSDAYREVEKEKIRLQRDEFEEKVSAEREKKAKPFMKFLRVWEVIYVLYFLGIVSSKYFLPELIGGIGILALVVFHLLCRRIIPTKKAWYSLAAIGLSVACMFLSLKVKDMEDELAASRELKKEASRTFVWPSSDLANLLPTPPVQNGKLQTYGDCLEVDVYTITQEDFTAYADECKKRGFTESMIEDETSFMARNEANNYLSIQYEPDEEKMNIFLSGSSVWSQITWPDTKVANLLPVPAHLYGEITDHADDRLKVTLEGYEKSEFDTYVKDCMDKGFDKKYTLKDGTFKGESDQATLSIQYDDSEDTMSIKIEMK